VQHPLRTAHLPQDVDVDRALAAGDLIGPLDLGDGTLDRVMDQLLVPLATGQRLVDLRDDPPFGIIAIGVDGGHGADAAGRRPGARAGMVSRGDALAALDQRPNLAATVKNGLQAFEQLPLQISFAEPIGRPRLNGAKKMQLTF
jgi:hypothetical protein